MTGVIDLITIVILACRINHYASSLTFKHDLPCIAIWMKRITFATF